MATVKTETIEGQKVNFEVDSKGTFSAYLGEDHKEITGRVLEDVEADVRKVLKKAKQQKPQPVTFVGIQYGRRQSWSNDEYSAGEDSIDVELRGYASRTRDWLITDAKGKKGKISKGYSDSGPVVCRRLTPEEHAEWKRLVEARRAAATAIEDFIGARKLDVKKLTEGE